VRRPPDRGGLAELLAVDPAAGPVLDAGLLAAVAGDLLLARAVEVRDPEIAPAIERLARLVGRNHAGLLASARGCPGRASDDGAGGHLLLRLLHAAAPAATGCRDGAARTAAPPGSRRRRLGRCCRRHARKIEAIGLTRRGVGERSAVIGPAD